MSSQGRGRGNPWNTRGGQNFNQKQRPNGPTEANIKSAQNKFQEARNRLQASVQKHINHDYESSSEEEELESENIFGKLIVIFNLAPLMRRNVVVFKVSTLYTFLHHYK